jgi:sugar lactone lactonase YvrE
MRVSPKNVRCLTQEPDLLGESPFWHPEEHCLYWLDIPGRALRRHRPGFAEERWPLPEEPGCVAPAEGGALIIALRSQVVIFNPKNSAIRTLAPAPYDTATMRFNDGRCDGRGRFWVGSLYEPKTAPKASLYCLERTPSAAWILKPHLGDAVTANGLAFSPDGQRAYWSDTPGHVIYAFDFDADAGVFSNRRIFQRFEPPQAGKPYSGRPDGACMDSAGNYWVALYEGGRLLQIAPSGQVLREIKMPVTCPTMPCLGGEGGRTLYVTSARRGRSAEELAREPWAGHVLAVDLDELGVPAEIRGLPAACFRDGASG